jgi:uncharacterized protein YcbK (DUF882 family)
MRVDHREVGHRAPLAKRVSKTLIALTVGACVSAAVVLSNVGPVAAVGDTRTISFYHIHTKESISVTYMKDGRYIPSAMKKINYLMRDWRRDSVIKIDPKTVDLIWELHEDLGSQRPVHIVCGYRSPKTNAFLKRVGRAVAKHSQHMNGQAIDFYFPDVPTQKIRNSALVRNVGGVGYYRSSGGPTGFLHVDTGKVRQWGPPISKSQWAQIRREGERTLGKRLREGGSFAVASEQPVKQKSGGLLSWFTGGNRSKSVEAPAPVVETPEEVNPVYAGARENLAELAGNVSARPVKPRLKQQPPQVIDEDEFGDEDIAQLSATIASEEKAQRPEGVKDGYPVPLPRLKPIEIMMMAAANMKIEPASAEPDDQLSKAKPSPVKVAQLQPLEGVEALIEEAFEGQQTNAAGKSDLAAEIRDGVAVNVPVIRPVLAASLADELDWWPQLLASSDALLRRNGAPPSLDSVDQGSLPVAAQLPAEPQIMTAGKSDLQVIVRETKGDLESAQVTVAAQ